MTGSWMALRHRHFVGQQERLWLFPGVSQARGPSHRPVVNCVLTAESYCFTRVEARMQGAQSAVTFYWPKFTDM